ncbi:SUKH-4 family immunity protein [Streptomyces scopuliridis]|uniref:SUKH-4 family immunity protein n=1 Tax=Streptomyces scopuliridis TaxID=452529 RepID=A0ACD4ZTM5_9ACTN|nr:SUKH-4 family immunity protein [Streptomyces scopuliridis]WSC01534.1 SUKH-4 family immunity protein [Streptomyces scopuliridis]WSC04928.1 SUKH-4 family immunity protein [Streptomyces scopuliridis]
MLTHITPEAVIEAFGLTSITYFPQAAPGHMHGPTADFLATIGLPESKFFGPRMDPEDNSAQRLRFGPSLKASFERAGSELPPEAETWEKLGDFVYATVALDPRDGRIYAFPEGESDYQLMHEDVSSLVHALIVLNRGRVNFRKLRPDDDEQRAQIVDRMTQEITAVDHAPFTDEEGEWETLFDQIRLNMWR